MFWDSCLVAVTIFTWIHQSLHWESKRECTHKNKKEYLRKRWKETSEKRRTRACFETVVSWPSPFSPEYINHCTEKVKESVHTSTREKTGEKHWKETRKKQKKLNMFWDSCLVSPPFFPEYINHSASLCVRLHIYPTFHPPTEYF